MSRACRLTVVSLLIGLDLVILTMLPGVVPVSSPPADTQVASHTVRMADSWPTPTNGVELIAQECAKASGIGPNDVLTPTTFKRLTSCIDLVRTGLHTTGLRIDQR